MATTVQKRVNGSFFVANHNHGHLTHFPGHEIAGVEDLRLVRQEYPSAGEYPLHLEAAHVVAHEDIAANQSTLDVHPIGCRRSPELRRHASTVKYHLLFNLIEVP
jgi:hypothetical protein